MRERGLNRLPSVLASMVMALLVTPLVASAASGLPATITIQPEEAGPGSTVEVVGLDFVAGEPVRLQLATAAGVVELGSLTADAGGYFREPVGLPADIAPGEWELRATGRDGATAVHAFYADPAVVVAAPAAATVATADAAPAPGGSRSPTDTIVMLIIGLLIGGIGGAAGYVYYQLHRDERQPGMGAGDDPIWSGSYDPGEPSLTGSEPTGRRTDPSPSQPSPEPADT